MRERKKKNIDDIKFQYVRSMSHLIKNLCNKASIRIHHEMDLLIEQKIKSFEPIKTKNIDSRTNSSIVEFRPNH